MRSHLNPFFYPNRSEAKKNHCEICGKEIEKPFTLCEDCFLDEYDREIKREGRR